MSSSSTETPLEVCQSTRDNTGDLINMAPPPRYSTISDSHMSTSSQGAESTPSANSVLSESSLVLQTGDISALEKDAKKEDESRPTSEAEWQARCIELELALQKFRDQAHNIRKLLRDKVRENILAFFQDLFGGLDWK